MKSTPTTRPSTVSADFFSNEDVLNLTGLGISKDGNDASAFGVMPLDVTSLSGGESTTFRVTYTPPSVGSHTAAVHIASNDPKQFASIRHNYLSAEEDRRRIVEAIKLQREIYGAATFQAVATEEQLPGSQVQTD